MRFAPLSLLITITVYLASCSTQEKAFSYLQSYTDSTKKDSLRTGIVDPVIQKNDLLSVLVYSASTIPETDALYNLPTTRSDEGYLVDANGNISLPRIGVIKVEGLTKEQLTDLVKQKLEATGELTNPNVIVRFLSYSITVLGEVSRPGRFQIPNERVTVLEAIGMAGDLTLFGKKNDVLIVREKDGQLEYGNIDLSSKDIVGSPYYFLSQNDVVIVNANKNKNRLNEQITAQRISLGLSIVTSLAILYNIFK
ncbi:MAG: polysaccharide export protein [Terrimonas sp.]|nr:polysaccharide export protein [Terrimonas sp.]